MKHKCKNLRRFLSVTLIFFLISSCNKSNDLIKEKDEVKRLQFNELLASNSFFTVSNKIRYYIAEAKGKSFEEVTLDADLFRDLNFDELDFLESIQFVESEFEIVIYDDDADKIKTVNDLAIASFKYIIDEVVVPSPPNGDNDPGVDFPDFGSGDFGGVGIGPNEWDRKINTVWPGDIKCASFKFAQSNSNQLSTKLTKIRPATFSEIGGISKSFNLRDLIIDVPKKYYHGATVTPGEAATFSAKAMNAAASTLGIIYGETGKYKTAVSTTYERDYIELFLNYLSVDLPGSRVSVDMGKRPDVKSTSVAQYDGFFDGIFGGDDCK
ncbi:MULTISPECIES: acyl carrier protein [unclassified Sphingobacterium]|uniref:acyl carrier protein n=1 Tax=unclassified Sphingobacterium TaxID=2609468 RepID=UPI0025E74194|nr:MULTISPECIES: acyl carrier protein [unclassified Sphingobacterium]